MERLITLGGDMARLWEAYGPRYLAGVQNTLILAVAATAIGCLIGLICGILNTIPYTRQDPLPKRFLLRLIRVVVRVYVEIFRGTPMMLQAVFIYYGLPYFTYNSVQFSGYSGIWACGSTASGWPPSWWCPSTPAPTWPSRCGAASSPSTPARPRGPAPSA